MVGKNLIDLKDVDGKAFVKERVDLAQSKGTFWQDYKFTNPVSKKIEPKQMYCEKLDDAVRAIHSAFDLDSQDVEAVVYGGTGR